MSTKYKFSVEEFAKYSEWDKEGVGGEYICSLMFQRGLDFGDEVVYSQIEAEFLASYTVYLKEQLKEARRITMRQQLTIFFLNLKYKLFINLYKVARLIGISTEEMDDLLAHEEDKNLLKEFR